MTILEKKTRLSVWKASDIVVGQVLAGYFILTKLSTLGNVSNAAHILHKIFIMGLAGNIVFRTSDWGILTLELLNYKSIMA